jgi:flagellar basal-body rod protein FlgC
MGVFSSFDVSASGMTAQRYRMDIIAENVANADTTRTADGTPYRRKVVTFEEKGDRLTFNHILNVQRREFQTNGVKVAGVTEDHATDMIMAYDPAHPDADENGYVTYPNVNIVTEMTNLIDASRAYEANSTAFGASKSIAMKGLQMSQ